MKKSLFLLLALLTLTVSGAWADKDIKLSFSGRTANCAATAVNVSTDMDGVTAALTSFTQNGSEANLSDKLSPATGTTSTADRLDIGQTNGKGECKLTFKVNGLNGRTVKAIKLDYFYSNGACTPQARGGSSGNSASTFSFSCTKAGSAFGTAITNETGVQTVTNDAPDINTHEFTASEAAAETADEMTFTLSVTNTGTIGTYFTITNVYVVLDEVTPTPTYTVNWSVSGNEEGDTYSVTTGGADITSGSTFDEGTSIKVAATAGTGRQVAVTVNDAAVTLTEGAYEFTLAANSTIAIVFSEVPDPTELNLTFARTSASAANATVKMQDDATYPGMAAAVSCTTGYQTNTNAAHLTPNQNFNAGANYTFTFKITGCPNDFKFDGIDLDVYAYTGGGDTQDSSTSRQVNLVLTENDADFASLNDADISLNAAAGDYGTGTTKIIHKTHNLYSTYPASYTTDGNGNITVTLNVTPGTSNAGSFFGLKSVRLYTYDKRPVAISQLSSAITNAKANSAAVANYTEGTELNQYTYSGTKADLDAAITTAETFQSNITDATTTQEIFDAATALNSKIITFTLNMPKKGTYLYIYSVKSSKYVALKTEGSAASLVTDKADASKIYYDENGKFSCGTLGFKNVVTATSTTSDWAAFSFGATMVSGSYGKYYIKTDAAATYPYWQATENATALSAAQFGNYDTNEFTLEEADAPVYPEETTRTVKVGDYGTVCLPYDATVNGAFVMTIGAKDKATDPTKLTFNYAGDDEASSKNLSAGVPYLFRALATTVTFTKAENASTVDDPINENGFYGTFSETPVSVAEGCYVVYDNIVQKCGTGWTMPQFHCWIVMGEVPETCQPSARTAVTFNLDETTGINFASAVEAQKDGKYLQNGRLVIVKDNKKFNAAGQLVK